ncbi:MAG TPA: ABC transporter ATP-binding protein [Pirellulales bacterium]|jgi:ABC-2 type transport system ATP-binding protein|nr:ABC transporter ATP-binding protein [Pirellulales bacterium]HEX4145185.1 ABC transporter ATP-binding protein [Pirellulales bacterium]
MIELEQVTKRYGRKVAVDGMNLAVQPGELFAFLGPNGAGKTTTIKMLVGLLRPNSGRVRVGGFDLATHSRQACQVLGYVPDEPTLYEKLTGREFLQFIASMYGLDDRQSRTRIEQQCAQFELHEFLDELAENYSHGMKQRLVFAAAMLHEPRVLIIDEPMVGLDPRSSRLLKDLLRERASAGVTIFMSTHTLALVEEIATRLAIVDHGRVRFCGTLEALRGDLARHDSSLESIFLSLTGDASTEPSLPAVPAEGR